MGNVEDGACPCLSNADCIPFGTGNLCNGNLVCTDGHCTLDLGSAVTCPETGPNSCFAWQCEGQTGTCVKAFSGIEVSCSDGNSCTQSDHCDSGTCTGTPVPNNSPCSLDNDACTQDYCKQGQCQAGPEKICPDAGACAQSVCDPISGKCVVEPLSGVACDDLDDCTIGEACQWGECLGGLYTCVDCTLAEMNGRPCDEGPARDPGRFLLPEHLPWLSAGPRVGVWQQPGCGPCLGAGLCPCSGVCRG